ncbi:uncharacterized protein LOC120352701 [Nilaparvata lugens]|uniref:uncharacterized protein LOC120352701 n=1 Tax=Nilaparvata lugens TaxID=108931 RepID=UPI00193CDBD4|nr:uncharacterized protein LOC120352701 [Nilaparvata lugens]
MLFAVIEFEKNSGEGLAIIREEWMTLRKKECFWPPYKNSIAFNKCLLNSKDTHEETWPLYEMKRVFYRTDDIRKAREKLRKAESDSEVLTEFDEGGKEKQKRRPVKKILFSSDSEDEAPVTKQIEYPEPPSELLVDVEAQHILTTNESFIAGDSDLEKPIEESCLVSSEHTAGHNISFTPQGTNSGHSVTSSSSKGLDVLAGHLARINRRLDDIEKNQSEILARLCPTKPAMNIIPPDIKLPCKTLDEISDLEDWLLDDTNKQSLVL